MASETRQSIGQGHREPISQEAAEKIVGGEGNQGHHHYPCSVSGCNCECNNAPCVCICENHPHYGS